MTASLVTYNHTFNEIRDLVLTVVASSVRHLVIIDNSSSKALEETVRGFSEKVIYKSSANIGFGAAHNLAMREAIRLGEDYHFVINPDISFEHGTLEKIIAYMEEHPEVGLIMPKTLNPDGTMQYNCKLIPSPFDLFIRYFLPKKMIRKHNDFFMMKDFDYECTMQVPYLCGCMMCFRVAALKDVGLFDERFFMYPEDIDITRRMWAMNWHPTYYPCAEVIHAHIGASYHSLKMFFIHAWNLVRYFNKWGWFFDAERKRINKDVLSKLHREVKE